MHVARKVLYVHGLESGPRGKKPRALEQAGYAVIAEQMPCGQQQVRRDPLVVAGALGALGLGAAGTVRWGLRGLAIAAGLATAAREPVQRAITWRMFERSVSVQLRALRDHQPDVVVGSSFGGAVALELLRRRAWSGPTVLLCPAHQLVCARSGRAWIPFTLDHPSRVAIVHALEDEVVPHDHAAQLSHELQIKLFTVQDDHRLSATATPDGLTRWVEHVARAV